MAGGPDAAWVWLDDRTPRDPELLARTAVGLGVREAFVSVPWGGPDERVRRTVAALVRRGLRVSALGGSPEWAAQPGLAGQWAERAHAGGVFAGTHLDVEPWVLPEWPGHAPDLLDGVAVAARAVTATGGGPVEVDLAPRLAVSHPAGFDALVRAADAVTLMSYRDTSEAVLDLTLAARGQLQEAGRPFRLALDTLPSPEPGSTFAGRTQDRLRQVVDEVVAQVARAPGFVGVAVHDLTGWADLRRGVG